MAEIGVEDFTQTSKSSIQMSVRYALFYGLFFILIVIYLGLVTAPQLDRSDFSPIALNILSFTSPFLPPEIEKLGGLIPAVLGGIVAASVRPQSSTAHFLATLALTAMVYVLYFHASLYYSPNSASAMELTNRLASVSLDPDETRKTLLAFVDSVRNISSFIFAGLIGVRATHSVSAPDNPVTPPPAAGASGADSRTPSTPALPEGAPVADESDQGAGPANRDTNALGGQGKG